MSDLIFDVYAAKHRSRCAKIAPWTPNLFVLSSSTNKNSSFRNVFLGTSASLELRSVSFVSPLKKKKKKKKKEKRIKKQVCVLW